MATIKDRPLALLKNPELIALNQDPLGLQAYVVQHVGETYVLVKDILTLHGNTRAVALYNPSDREEEMCISFSEVDLGGNVKVRDLFEHQDLGEKEGSLSVVVPPHGTRIYKLEAEKRLDRYIYEAETGFMHDYQEIYNNQSVGSAIYETNSAASGGAYASWLGGKRSNSLLWRDVFVADEGDYMVHFCGSSAEARSLNVVLNGEEMGKINMNTSNWSTFKEYNMTLHLNAGSNSIELYNEKGWMPNMDYMSLEKAGESTILTRKLEEAVYHLEVLTHNELMPNKLRKNVESLLARAQAEGLTESKIKTILTEVQNIQNNIAKIMPLCDEYIFWKAYAEKNVQASMESSALASFVKKIANSESTLSQATTESQASTALNNLKSAVTTYLKASSAVPKEGEYLDMTLFIANYDFSAKEGWEGEPTYRDGCGEEFNKSFDMYQTLPSMRPGVYTVRCNAFYRTGGNDGGAAYRSKKENIQAYLYINNKVKKLKSLYSEMWPDAAQYGSVDNQNGYPHSMRAAGIRFAEGCYPNEVAYTLQEKGSLRFGLKCDKNNGSSWCCFDNFSLLYQPLPDYYDGMESIHNSQFIIHNNDTYDLTGRKVNPQQQRGIVIKDGKKMVK